MKSMILVILSSIFLQASLSCAHGLHNRLVVRDLTKRNNDQMAEQCQDNNGATNLYKCENERGPVVLEDCYAAAAYLTHDPDKTLSTAGSGSCGVIIYRKHPFEIAEVPPEVTAEVLRNTVDDCVQACCVEAMPQVMHPVMSDVLAPSLGITMGIGKLESPYEKPAELTEGDIKPLLTEAYPYTVSAN